MCTTLGTAGEVRQTHHELNFVNAMRQIDAGDRGRSAPETWEAEHDFRWFCL